MCVKECVRLEEHAKRERRPLGRRLKPLLPGTDDGLLGHVAATS